MTPPFAGLTADGQGRRFDFPHDPALYFGRKEVEP
jgi:hypothetical protein